MILSVVLQVSRLRGISIVGVIGVDSFRAGLLHREARNEADASSFLRLNSSLLRVLSNVTKQTKQMKCSSR